MEQSRVIVVSVRMQYGKRVFVPECETGRMFAELLGQSRLTPADVELIKKLGFRFETKAEAV